MSGKDSEDSALTVKTPWGALVTGKGAQLLLERFADDISALKSHLTEVERKGEYSRPDFVSRQEELVAQVRELERKIKQLSQRIEELDSRFSRSGLTADQQD